MMDLVGLLGGFYVMQAHLSDDLVAVEHRVWQAGVDFARWPRVNIRHWHFLIL